MTTISDYYRAQEIYLRREIENITDEAVLSYERGSWLAHLLQTYALEPIVCPADRTPQMRLRAERPPRVRVQQPVTPSDTLTTIFKDHLQASTITHGPLSMDSFVYDEDHGMLSVDVPGDPGSVNGARARLVDQIEAWNRDIERETRALQSQIEARIERRIHEANSTAQFLATLETTTGIPLVRRADLESVVPVELKAKRVIAPLLVRAREPRPTLDAETTDAILQLLDNQCRQFERTPSVFAALTEEDLRDIMLSSLNAVFAGAALGEAFQGLGKADIHLRLSDGELFIAEVKVWRGPETVREATAQLLERLTWHESYGAVLMFSKNTDFGEVRNSLRGTLPGLPEFRGPVTEVASYRLASVFSLPSQPSKLISTQHLVYNLYTTRPSGRSASARMRTADDRRTR